MPDTGNTEKITLVDRFIRNAHESRQLVSVYLVNGFQLKGQIVEYDEETILFKHKDIHQLIMRAAVASMYPVPNSKKDAAEWWRNYLSTGTEE